MTGFALLALAALSLACGPQQAADTLVDSDDAELRAIAAELLPDLARRSGLELKRPVRLERRSREDLARYLRVKLDEELPPAEAAAITESYRLLGLVPDGLDLRALLLSVYTEQVAAFYDPDSTALFVMDDQPAEELRTVLVHELVHAVQDQSVDLDSLTDRARGNDRQMAAQAAIEGHAYLVMFEYAAEQQMGQGAVDLSVIPDFGARIRPMLDGIRTSYPELARAPRLIQESMLFPYLEGAVYVQRLWRDSGARPSPLGEWLPQSTEQVLGEGARDEPTEVRLRLAGERYTNTLGRMEVGVLLRELAGADAAGAARGWDGDRFTLVDEGGASGLAWFTVWDDAAARDRFVAALRPALGRLPATATLETRDVDGRPGALLRVGTRTPVEVTLGMEAAR